MLTPFEAEMVQADVTEMFDPSVNADATSVTLTWNTWPGAADETFGDHEGQNPTPETDVVGCIVKPVSKSDVAPANWGNMATGDAILMFAPGTDLSHQDLQIVASNGTTWVPDQNPPESASLYARKWLGSSPMAQWLYCRLQK